MATISEDSPREGWLVRSARAIEGWIAANRVPLTVFAVSRLGLLLSVYVALLVFGVEVSATGEPTHAQMNPDNLLIDGWARWDSFYYRRIALEGYSLNVNPANNGVRVTQFFPLYSITLRAANLLIGNIALAGMIVSSVAFLFVLVLLYQLTILLFDESVARRTITLLAVSPFSYYFSAVYSESLFTLLSVGAFYFALRERWGWAVVFAALAGATRVPGILLFGGLTFLYLEQRRFDLRRLDRRVLLLPISLLGIVTVMILFWISFGDPLYFTVGQATSVARAVELMSSFVRNLNPSTFLAGQFYPPFLIHGGALLVALVLTVLAWRRLPYRALALWCLMSLAVILPLWAGGYARYTLPLFPLFITAALLLKKPAHYQMALFVCTLFLGIFSAVFATWHWVS